jgi:hypothetical protein
LPHDRALRRATRRGEAVNRRHSFRVNAGRMLSISANVGHRLALERKRTANDLLAHTPDFPSPMRQYWSALATSPPRVVLIALQVRMSTEFLTKRTEPSPIATFKPPGCRLRAP